MPRKITQTEVAYQLHEEYVKNALGIDIRTYDQDTIPITYDAFERVMMKDEFISSTSTVRAKWKGLAASGILIPTSRDRARISVVYFKTLLYLSENKYHKHTENTQNTHTMNTEVSE